MKREGEKQKKGTLIIVVSWQVNRFRIFIRKLGLCRKSQAFYHQNYGSLCIWTVDDAKKTRFSNISILRWILIFKCLWMIFDPSYGSRSGNLYSKSWILWKQTLFQFIELFITSSVFFCFSNYIFLSLFQVSKYTLSDFSFEHFCA